MINLSYYKKQRESNLGLPNSFNSKKHGNNSKFRRNDG